MAQISYGKGSSGGYPIRQCVILVGGRGTRLGPLATDTPKPMIKIGGIPFLDYLLDFTARYRFEEIMLLAGHLGERMRERYQGRRFRDATVRCFVEDSPGGTAGALSGVRGRLDSTFLMMNGDSIFDFNFNDLVFFEPKGPWVGKMALREVPEAKRFGTVRLNGVEVTEFMEKTRPGPGVINGGIYIFRKEIVERIESVPCSIEKEVLPGLAGDGLLYGKVFDGFFIDIGVPEDLERAQDEIPRRFPVPR